MPGPMSDFGRIAELAASQLGLVSVGQAESLGVSRSRLQRATRIGQLRRMHTDVYCFAAVPPSWPQRIRAASMQVPGSTVSHEAALGFAGIDRLPQVVAISVGPMQRSRLADVRVHRVSDLGDSHITTVNGVRTTTVARAVVDVSSVFRHARLERLIDEVTIHRRLTSPAAISRVLLEVNRRGRRDIGVLIALLDERRPSGPVDRSKLERRFDRLLAGSALPEPVKEMPLPGEGTPLGLADRGWPDARLIVEIDGRTWHSRERAMRTDRERDRQAAQMGWLVVRYLDEEIDQEPESVLADLERIHSVRLAQLTTAAG